MKVEDESITHLFTLLSHPLPAIIYICTLSVFIMSSFHPHPSANPILDLRLDRQNKVWSVQSFFKFIYTLNWAQNMGPKGNERSDFGFIQNKRHYQKI